MTSAFAQRSLWTVLMASEFLVVGWLCATEGLGDLGLFILIVGLSVGALAIVFTNWPIGCLFLLTLAAAMPRFNVKVGELHLRPEHVVTGVAILAISTQLLRGLLPSVRLRNFDYFVLAYILVNFVSSAFTSPQPSMTLRWACLNALVVTPYFIARILIRNDRHVWLALMVLLWVGMGEAIYGTVASISNHLWDTTWGIELGQYGEIPGTYGTQYEANLFGSYTASAAIMFLTLFLFDKDARRWRYGLGVGLGLVAAFFSLARSVLLGLPIPILVLLFMAFKKGRFQLRKLLPLAIGASIMLLIISPFVLEYVQTRFSTLGVSDVPTDSSTAGRLVQMAAAVDHVVDHPILGTGTSSFQLLFKLSDLGILINYEDNDVGWISNSPLRILHDTGIIGLGIFLAFIVTLGRAAYRSLKVASSSTRVSIAALTAGLLLYAITFQATEATLLTFTWIHFGLLAAAVSVAVDGTGPVESTAA